MNKRNTPKTHLVPVIKGVSDPAKGLIFRTYHVRPEQLQASLKDAMSQPDKIHVPTIKNYTKLSKAINTKDITHLRTMFSKDSTVWESLVKRNKHEENKVQPQKEKQKLMQSTYAYVLSQDSVFTQAIKEHSRKAALSTSVKIQHSEHAPSKKSRVSEQVTLKPNEEYIEYQELLSPVTLPFTKKKDVLKVENNKNEIDTGTVLTKTKIVEQTSDYENLSKELSAYLNFLNPSSNKLVDIHSLLLGKSNEGNSVAKNLTLRPNIYGQNKQYWSDTLSANLTTYLRANEENDMLPSSVFYSSLILKDVDKKRYYDILSSHSDDDMLQVLEQNKPEQLITGNYLQNKSKVLYVAALNTEDTTKNKDNIISEVKELHFKNKEDESLSLLSAYSNHLETSTTFKLLNSVLPNNLSIQKIVNDVLTTDTGNAFSYLLLQLISSKIAKLHYVPYDDINIFKEHPFVPTLILKVFREFFNYKFNDFSNFVKSHSNESVDVGIPYIQADISDRQLFYRLKPMMRFEIADTNKEYMLTGTVKKNAILAVNDKHVLVHNAINNVTFR